VNLSNRTALITGGSGGIGLGMAEAFHSRGSTVILCGRDEKRLSATANRLPGVVALSCDLANRQQREELAAEVLRRFPKLDILETTPESRGTSISRRATPSSHPATTRSPSTSSPSWS